MKNNYGNCALIPLVVLLDGEGSKMNQSIEAPSAARWLALARDRHASADEMSDAQAKHLMRHIANGYERLALHAAERDHVRCGA
jgi:hypothetical protein